MVMDHNIKTRKNGLIAILLIGVVLATGISSYIITQTKPQAEASQTTRQTSQPATPDKITFTAKKGETVLAQLKTVAKVTTKDSSYGLYVDGINGLNGGRDGKYWSYYIDGKLASVGAASYVSKGGEKIEWKLEKIQ